jgi:hypothetical protein
MRRALTRRNEIGDRPDADVSQTFKDLLRAPGRGCFRGA